MISGRSSRDSCEDNEFQKIFLRGFIEAYKLWYQSCNERESKGQRGATERRKIDFEIKDQMEETVKAVARSSLSEVNVDDGVYHKTICHFARSKLIVLPFNLQIEKKLLETENEHCTSFA